MKFSIGPQKTILTGAFLVLSLMLFSMQAVASFQPVYKPSLKITKSITPARIDGQLDDPTWKTARKITDFVERSPGDNTEPLAKTEAFITYDDEYLYVAFRCYDDPMNVRATLCQRDGFNGDDAVSISIDTYGDASWAYVLLVNPHGVQKDLLWTNIMGEDDGFDMIWNAAAKITETGYQVEIAVPFASIRFPNRPIQTWKINFQRNHPRDLYRTYSWAAYDRNEQCAPCQWGTVEGIADVKPGKGIEILPALIANQAGYINNYNDADLALNNENITGELSLGGKYSFNSDITLEATINPDFSQVEADAGQIDVNSTISLFYPERRPFFAEGRDIFRTLFNSFYSRTINDPQLAVKLTGRSDSYRFGVLSAVDENSPYLIPLEERSLPPINVGKSYVNIVRAAKSFGGSSHIGFIFNDRRFEEGGFNTVFALDKNIRLSKNYFIDGQYIATFSREPDAHALTEGFEGIRVDGADHDAAFNGEYFRGFGFISRFMRNARHWNFNIGYSQVDQSYMTQTGYDPWINNRNFIIWSTYNIYVNKGLVERFNPWIHLDNRWNLEGVHKWSHHNIGLETHFNFAQTRLNLYHISGFERWNGHDFDDLYLWNIELGTRPVNMIGFSMAYTFGKSVARFLPATADEQTFGLAAHIKPLDRLMVDPSFNYFKMDDHETGSNFYEGFIARTRIQYQATKELSLRLVAQYDDFNHQWDIDPLVTVRLNSFSIFYVGMTSDYIDYGNRDYDYLFNNPNTDRNWKLDSRQFFMKIQYLFHT